MFALILEKITRANDPTRGLGQDVPPLEDLPVRPYVNDDKMTVEKNNSAKVLWDFKEKQAKKARKIEKKEAVLKAKTTAARQEASNREEAKFCTGAMKEGFAKLSKANDKYGPDLEASLLMTRTAVEMMAKGQADYVVASTGYRKDYKAATSVSKDIISNMSLKNYPLAQEEVLREAGIGPHMSAFQSVSVTFAHGPPPPLPPSTPPPQKPVHGSRTAPVEVEPEVVKKPVPPPRAIPKKTAPASTPASSSSSGSSSSSSCLFEWL